MIQIISIKEHECLPQEVCEPLKDVPFVGMPDVYMGTPEKLGIAWSGNQLQASYYIGVDWLGIGIPCMVLPKLNTNDGEKVDFLRMFADALSTGEEDVADYFTKCYGIDFQKPTIECAEMSNILTPLILYHFIAVMEMLVKQGVKKGYVSQEDNLQGKMRGRIAFQQHLSKNVFPKREDRVYCKFQEYTEDIPENQLLKKALLFTAKALNTVSNSTMVKKKVANLFVPFTSVSSEVEAWQVAKVQSNKLYRHYGLAMRLAKLILKRYSYNIDNVSNSVTTPPFWIDMPRLYELYVYGVLKQQKNEIKFQAKGAKGTQADYLMVDKELHQNEFIVDAKYKLCYDSGQSILADIREIAGYARDKKLLKLLGYSGQAPIIPCLIVHPTALQNTEDFDFGDATVKLNFPITETALMANKCQINCYERFYHLAIPVPMK